MRKRRVLVCIEVFLVICFCGCQRVTEQNSSRITTGSKAVATIATKQPSKGVHLIEGVPLICQFPAYPTGCETVASVIALQYMGEQISVDTFIDTYLEKGALYRKDGILYGPDPYEKFVGDPRSPYSLGCFAPVMQKALIHYFGNDERIKNTTGESLESLCRTYIQQDIPVIVWVSIQMKETGKGNVWYAPAGERFEWVTNEHCMVLVGYDANGYYFNDPYSGKQLYYDKALSARRYDIFGKQSLVILP